MGKNKVKAKFGFCDYCEQEIENPGRKSLDEMEKTIVAVVFVSTIGVGILVSIVLIIMLRKILLIIILNQGFNLFWVVIITSSQKIQLTITRKMEYFYITVRIIMKSLKTACFIMIEMV